MESARWPFRRVRQPWITTVAGRTLCRRRTNIITFLDDTPFSINNRADTAQHLARKQPVSAGEDGRTLMTSVGFEEGYHFSGPPRFLHHNEKVRRSLWLGMSQEEHYHFSGQPWGPGG